MRPFRWLTLALLVLAAGAADRARAAYVLTLDPVTTIATVGEVFDIDVFLEQTDGDTGLDSGLIAAELRVDFSSTSADALALVTGVAPNAEFDDVFELIVDFPMGASTGLVVLRMTDIAGILPTDDRILLGTLTVMARGPGVTTLVASGFDPDPSFVNFATVDEDLDVAPGTGSITVAIPEPASLALVGTGLLAGLALARSRRAPR